MQIATNIIFEQERLDLSPLPRDVQKIVIAYDIIFASRPLERLKEWENRAPAMVKPFTEATKSIKDYINEKRVFKLMGHVKKENLSEEKLAIDLAINKVITDLETVSMPLQIQLLEKFLKFIDVVNLPEITDSKLKLAEKELHLPQESAQCISAFDHLKFIYISQILVLQKAEKIIDGTNLRELRCFFHERILEFLIIKTLLITKVDHVVSALKEPGKENKCIVNTQSDDNANPLIIHILSDDEAATLSDLGNHLSPAINKANNTINFIKRNTLKIAFFTAIFLACAACLPLIIQGVQNKDDTKLIAGASFLVLLFIFTCCWVDKKLSVHEREAEQALLHANNRNTFFQGIKNFIRPRAESEPNQARMPLLANPGA